MSFRLTKMGCFVMGLVFVVGVPVSGLVGLLLWNSTDFRLGLARAYFPSTSTGKFLANIEAANDANDHYKDIAFIDLAIKQAPHDPELHLIRGAEFQALSMFECMLEDGQAAVKLQPELPYANSTVGIASAALKKDKEAVEAFTEALKLDPNSGDDYQHRAESLRRLGKTEEAIKDYDSMIAVDPNNSERYWGKGVALLEAKKSDEALKVGQDGLKAYPTWMAMMELIGLGYLQKKDYANALKWLDASEEADGRIGEPHYYESLIYDAQGDKARAEQERAEADKRSYYPARDTKVSLFTDAKK